VEPGREHHAHPGSSQHSRQLAHEIEVGEQRCRAELLELESGAMPSGPSVPRRTGLRCRDWLPTVVLGGGRGRWGRRRSVALGGQDDGGLAPARLGSRRQELGLGSVWAGSAAVVADDDVVLGSPATGWARLRAKPAPQLAAQE
jgi:hypothetical protein